MTKRRSPEQAELEIQRRLALMALAGYVPRSPSDLLLWAFTKYVVRWRLCNWHSRDPERTLLVRSFPDIRYIITAGTLREYVGHSFVDCAPEIFTSLIYAQVRDKPAEMIRILDLVEQWTPERAKPRL